MNSRLRWRSLTNACTWPFARSMPAIRVTVPCRLYSSLAAHEVKPHKVRYYLERRDPEFEPKMAEVLCVYREVAMRRAEPGGGAQQPTVAVISYDEKPGIQAIGAVAPDRRPVPGVHPTISRDHEYERHGISRLRAPP